MEYLSARRATCGIHALNKLTRFKLFIERIINNNLNLSVSMRVRRRHCVRVDRPAMITRLVGPRRQKMGSEKIDFSSVIYYEKK
jgi:hypothetical protein